MATGMQAKATAEPLNEIAGPQRALRRERAMVEIGLNAAILAVRDHQPLAHVVRQEGEIRGGIDGLPYGPFSPIDHRTLDTGLRAWVSEQTGLELGYVEQLYTFGDRGRHAQPGDAAPHVVSIGYVALTLLADQPEVARGVWRGWYEFFPWEDWRDGRPAIIADEIAPRLIAWAERPRAFAPTAGPQSRSERVQMCFGLDGARWDEEKVLERYELLYEAGLVEEANRDGRDGPDSTDSGPLQRLGLPMRFDHRRILATAIGRIRSKIKYRPVVFELMPDDFTLFELQRTVEAVLGNNLHKQNFRRQVETAGLVEETEAVRTRTGGRPAKLFRFRHEVLLERPSPGVRVKVGRG